MGTVRGVEMIAGMGHPLGGTACQIVSLHDGHLDTIVDAARLSVSIKLMVEESKFK